MKHHVVWMPEYGYHGDVYADSAEEAVLKFAEEQFPVADGEFDEPEIVEVEFIASREDLQFELGEFCHAKYRVKNHYHVILIG